MASTFPEDIVARYKRLMTDTSSTISSEEVLEILRAASEYLAAATSVLGVANALDPATVRETRVGLRNAARSLLGRAGGLDVTAQRALEQFINEQPEFLTDNYKFTQDFFSSNLDLWTLNLARFYNLPNLNFLEIGSFEGFSTCWLLKNVLTSDSSRLTCIDTFDFAGQGPFSRQHRPSETMSIEERFDFNIKLTGSAHKVRKIVGLSREALRSLPFDEFDFIYIDGSHVAADVLEDAVLSWPLLKSGGLMTFDDYEWQKDPSVLRRPGIAIDAFLNVFRTRYRLIHKAYQISVEKLETN
jgi:hypothetical protein